MGPHPSSRPSSTCCPKASPSPPANPPQVGAAAPAPSPGRPAWLHTWTTQHFLLQSCEPGHSWCLGHPVCGPPSRQPKDARPTGNTARTLSAERPSQHTGPVHLGPLLDVTRKTRAQGRGRCPKGTRELRKEASASPTPAAKMRGRPHGKTWSPPEPHTQGGCLGKVGHRAICKSCGH